MKLAQRKAKACMLPVLMFLVFTALPFLSKAQADFESSLDAAGTGTDGGLHEAPIDGGTVFLVAAGVLFGVYKLYKVAQSKSIAMAN